MNDPHKTYWGNMIFNMGMAETRPIKCKYNADKQIYAEEGYGDDDYGGFEAFQYGLHRDGPNSHHVTFISENRQDVVHWMYGVVSAMATVGEWAALGCGNLEHTKHFGDEG